MALGALACSRGARKASYLARRAVEVLVRTLPSSSLAPDCACACASYCASLAALHTAPPREAGRGSLSPRDRSPRDRSPHLCGPHRRCCVSALRGGSAPPLGMFRPGGSVRATPWPGMPQQIRARTSARLQRSWPATRVRRQAARCEAFRPGSLQTVSPACDS